MKSKTMLVIVGLLAGFANRSWAPPPLTAFTYQGRLTEASAPINGLCDFRLGIFDEETAGDLIGLRVDLVGVAVSNGLFTVECDPGEAVFDGSPRWLQISVRTNGGALTTLTPRQRLTATPQAQFAVTASQANSLSTALPANQIAGTLADAQLSANMARLNTSPTFQGEVRANRFAGNGAGLTNVNAATLGGLAPGAFWQLNGNAGTTPGTHFLGTTDNQPFELKVNGFRALRLEAAATGEVNIVMGYVSNQIAGAASRGSVIAGGGAPLRVHFQPPQGYSTNYNFQYLAASYATIGGGASHSNQSDYAVIGGGLQNTIGTNANYSVIGGGADNRITESWGATLAGGSLNATGPSADWSTIGGGANNQILTGSRYTTLTGGYKNVIGTNSDYGTIGGGGENQIRTDSVNATIAGGVINTIGTNSSYSAIGGGAGNKIAANSESATIPGGENNSATNHAFAAGFHAKANHTGTFVWGDATDADIVSTNANSVTMRATGGYRLFSDSTALAGVSLAPGSTAWAVMSDRNVKKDFAPVDCLAILEKLAALPVTQWHYKWEKTNTTPHIGPMAQDFKAAFYPGTDDKSITTLEADGVALAAIQGLNQKVEAENAALKQELAELKALVNQLVSQPKQPKP